MPQERPPQTWMRCTKCDVRFLTRSAESIQHGGADHEVERDDTIEATVDLGEISLAHARTVAVALGRALDDNWFTSQGSQRQIAEVLAMFELRVAQSTREMQQAASERLAAR